MSLGRKMEARAEVLVADSPLACQPRAERKKALSDWRGSKCGFAFHDQNGGGLGDVEKEAGGIIQA